ncbi:MAG: hypothetical protein IPJ12_08905 [Betaproteobacteria bacterium]|jgi:hypothetical protein|nr:hypothetical protein [Betaproteobacteria bacterium]
MTLVFSCPALNQRKTRGIPSADIFQFRPFFPVDRSAAVQASVHPRPFVRYRGQPEKTPENENGGGMAQLAAGLFVLSYDLLQLYHY